MSAICRVASHPLPLCWPCQSPQGAQEDRQEVEIATGMVPGTAGDPHWPERSHHSANRAGTLLVSVASEAARVFQQRSDRLVGFHLVEHRTLHLTRYVHKTVVRAYNNHVVVGETHIARELAVEDIVVDVDGCYKTVVAIYLDITERTDVVCAASHVESVEDCSDSRECGS